MSQKGYFVETTVFADIKDDMTIAKEEIFGPVMSVIKFKTIEEAVKKALDTDYGLASGVVTSSIDSAIQVSEAMRSGQVYVNNWGP